MSNAAFRWTVTTVAGALVGSVALALVAPVGGTLAHVRCSLFASVHRLGGGADPAAALAEQKTSSDQVERLTLQLRMVESELAFLARDRSDLSKDLARRYACDHAPLDGKTVADYADDARRARATADAAKRREKVARLGAGSIKWDTFFDAAGHHAVIYTPEVAAFLEEFDLPLPAPLLNGTVWHKGQRIPDSSYLRFASKSAYWSFRYNAEAIAEHNDRFIMTEALSASTRASDLLSYARRCEAYLSEADGLERAWSESADRVTSLRDRSSRLTARLEEATLRLTAAEEALAASRSAADWYLAYCTD